MSSIFIDTRRRSLLPGAPPARDAAPRRDVTAHWRPAISFGKVVAAGDLVALSAVVALTVPTLLQWWVPAFVAGILGLSALRGQYRTRITMSVARDAGPIVTSVAVSLVALSVLEGLNGHAGIFAETGVAAGVAVLAVLVARAGVYASIRRGRRRGSFGERTLIIGAGPVAVRFAETLEEHPEYGLRPVGFLDDCEGE
ncbi:MAG TPA: hypothetical protein VND70_06875, partial [Acidimicrobiales bacterium]|nr:hypothetical protein [Acidimicrobiales bacterium]